MFDKEGYQRDLWQGCVRMKCGMTCHQEIRTTIVERNLGANKVIESKKKSWWKSTRSLKTRSLTQKPKSSK
jgi:hypothetical protein